MLVAVAVPVPRGDLFRILTECHFVRIHFGNLVHRCRRWIQPERNPFVTASWRIPSESLARHREPDGKAGPGRLVDREDDFERFAGVRTGHRRLTVVENGSE